MLLLTSCGLQNIGRVNEGWRLSCVQHKRFLILLLMLRWQLVADQPFNRQFLDKLWFCLLFEIPCRISFGCWGINWVHLEENGRFGILCLLSRTVLFWEYLHSIGFWELILWRTEEGNCGKECKWLPWNRYRLLVFQINQYVYGIKIQDCLGVFI